MPPFKRTIKNRIRGVAWSLYGKFLRNPGFPENARKILFVCKGNICRSPFAELLSKQIMSRKVKSSCAYEFASVGIMLPDTKSPPTEAIHSARQFDVEMAMHHPKLINYSIMASSDMIIVMDVWQFKYLRKIFVEHSYKI
ncbi:MAG: hypothetical protein IH577_00590, partial [Deltaproteobacteria bacterium]|nr:hypothetical protein [Deltaproteobacteria bacterium]